MATRSIKSVLYEKFLDSLSRASWQSMFWGLSRFVLAIVAGMGLAFMPVTIKIVKFAWFYGDFMLAKLFLGFLLVFGWRLWVSSVRWIVYHVKDSVEEILSKTQEAESSIRGIPIPELVDYVFETKGFRIKETMERFAISRGTYDFLVNGFDLSSVFIRGENNARVLNPSFSRTDVVSILWKADVEGFKPLHRKDGESSYTTKPSMPEILERNSPVSAGGFTVRPISGVSA